MLGFEIFPRQQGLDSRTISSFLGLPVANVSDCRSRMAAGGTGLRPFHKPAPLAGSDFTVKTRPGDNLMVHKALQMALPGDVVVVDAGGDLTNAIIGELMIAFAKSRGLSGIVIDGGIRDLDAIAADNFPIYARGVTHRGPHKDGPGSINVTISIGGMTVEPGDLIIGDQDGLLSVPAAAAREVLEENLNKRDEEEKQMAATLAGTSDRDWVDRQLAELGCKALVA